MRTTSFISRSIFLFSALSSCFLFVLATPALALTTSVTTITGAGGEPSSAGQTYEVAVNVSGTGATPTGSVAVFVDDNAGCTATLVANGEGVCTISSLLTPGTYSLTAVYGGDANFSVSTSTSFSHQIDLSDAFLSIFNGSSLTAEPSFIGAGYAVQWIVSDPFGGGSISPTGTVTVSDGTDSCSADVNAGQCTLTSSSAGTKTITVSYGGDSNFRGTSATTNHTVTNDLYVDGATGSDSNGGASDIDPFETIQHALDVAPDSAVIHVAAGTYDEELTVKSDVTIVGAATSTTIIQPTAAPAPGVFDIAFGSGSSGATLENFTLDFNGTDGTRSGLGIVVSDLNGPTVQNVSILSNDIYMGFGEGAASTGAGVGIQTGKDADVSGLTIQGNFFHGDSSWDGSSDGSTSGAEGVYVNPNAGSGAVTIAENTFDGYLFTGISVESGNVTVSGNTISEEYGTEVASTQGVRVNDFVGGVTYSGISFSDNTITGFANGARFGSSASSGSTLTISFTGNTVTGNTRGLWVRNDANVTAHTNTITGTVAAENLSNGNGILDATENYWGTDLESPAGLLTGTVSYFPWYVDSNLTTLTNSSNAAVAVDDDWSAKNQYDHVTLSGGDYYYGINAFSGIQDGIDAVSASNGTVHVAAGTYTEDLAISSSFSNLDLSGAGAGSTTVIGVATQSQASFPDTSSSTNIDIQGAGTKVHGFTIESPDAASGMRASGVVLTGANIEIYNNVFIERQQGSGSPAGDGNTNVAVQTYHTNNHVASDDINGLSVHDNTFSGTPFNGYYAVYVNPDASQSTAVSVANNIISGTVWRGITTERTNSSISGNSVTSDTAFPGGSGIRAVAFSDPGVLSSVSITGNDINALGGAGFETGLLFGWNGGSGTFSNVSTEDNTIQGAAYGVRVFESAGGIALRNNTFDGNTEGVVNDSREALVAATNWWGSAQGPTASDNANSSTGDSVSSGVSYRPWCANLGCSDIDTDAVSVSGTTDVSVVKAGSAVTVMLTFNKSMNTTIAPVVVAGFSSGTTTVSQTSYSGDTWIGTVAVPSVGNEESVAVDIAGAEDPYGNQLGTTTAATFTADDLAPSISSITSDAGGSGALKIGDTVTFTLTPSKQEANATVSGSYNGHTLTWSSANSGLSYTATYTVTSGDDDQTSALQITGVTITDEAGNESASADGSDVVKTIDANAPVVTTTISYDHFSPGNADSSEDTTDVDAVFDGTYSYSVRIQNSSGAFVKLLQATTTAANPGTKTWDGTDDSSQVAEGTYTVVVTAKDDAGNTTNDARDIIVDNTAPDIALSGNNPETLEVHGAYADAGSTVTDNVDTGLAAVVDDSALDVDTVGSYVIGFSAIDAAGNATSTTRTVSVVDTTVPVITLIGNNPLYVAINNTFADPGADVTDNYDAATTTLADDTPDMSVAGTYTLHYNHSDDNSNAAVEVTRTVIVEGSSFSLATSTVGSTVVGTIATAATTSASSGSVTATFAIPAGTTVTGTSTWDGIVNFPTISSSYTSPTAPSGYTDTVTLAVEAGSDEALTFDQGVRILFSGQAGNRVGWSRNGVFTEITDTCSADSQTVGDALADGADCKISVGSDLVVWTKHFTTFLSYAEIKNPTVGNGSPGGVGGGGGGSAGASGGSVGGGAVLGAAAYNFTHNLTLGSTGQDVTELQKILLAEGFDIPALSAGGAYGYFGAQTKAAVSAYQKAHGISPQSGYVGPLTRVELNKGSAETTPETGTVLGASTTKLSDAQVTAILNLLNAFDADSSVIANVRAALTGR